MTSKKPKVHSKDCLDVLKEPDLFFRFQEEFKKKIAGEEKTIMTLFISACSIYVKNIGLNPNCFISSESSAGKSHTTKQIFDIFPDTLKLHRTKLTPEVFTYWQPFDTWDGKILFIEDPKNSFLNSDTFKVMMSEGTKATIVVKQIAKDIVIKGMPFILLTTADTRPKTEIINRFNIVPLDESKEQNLRVMKFLAKGDTEPYDGLYKAALGTLQRVKIKIPYADKLTGVFPTGNIKISRDFNSFLALIKCSTALHQLQREWNGAGEVIADDIDYGIARIILSHIQSNELMIALDHKSKKCYDTCIKLTKEKEDIEMWGFKVAEVHAKNPALGSAATIYKLIDGLAHVGLLEAKLDETHSSNRPATLYKAKKSNALALPNYKELMEVKKL